MKRVALLLLLLAAPAAQAQLYRWVDPATGSTKFSSVPPPWYGDPALERRAPKTERIPAGVPAPAARGNALDPGSPATTPGTAAAPSSPLLAPPPPKPLSPLLAIADAQRRALLKDLGSALAQDPVDNEALQKRMQELRALTEELDRADPLGAAARQAEVQAMAESLLRARDVNRPR